MKIYTSIWCSLLLILTTCASAETNTTKRIPQFSNDKVNIWQTVIYPSKEQQLKLHRHDSNRVLVALTDGVLKITNNQGKIHYLKLKQDHAYYLTKDVPGEVHADENVSKHPIKVLVVELKN